jgi:hypothetical protein
LILACQNGHEQLPAEWLGSLACSGAEPVTIAELAILDASFSASRNSRGATSVYSNERYMFIRPHKPQLHAHVLLQGLRSALTTLTFSHQP